LMQLHGFDCGSLEPDIVFGRAKSLRQAGRLESDRTWLRAKIAWALLPLLRQS
jgi:hypothetical protein